MWRSIRVAAAHMPLVVALLASSSLVWGQSGATNGEWPHWGGDLGSTKYSSLDQINRDNVKNLKVAWRWKADNYSQRAIYNMEATPLMVGGVLYTTVGMRPGVVAIDGATGETLWFYRVDEGRRGETAPRNLNRGVEYWTDGRQERILVITRGYRLISLDAKTGIPDPAFGKNGIVDLYEDFDQPTPKEGTIGSTSPAVVVKDVVVVGAALLAGSSPKSMANTKGYVRGYDVRTGKRIWIFHTIPLKGEYGYDTWLGKSAEYTGNTAVWSPFSADPELGYVYLPVESATGDAYGGHRPGQNLFSGSLVCLDAKTGKRIWHQQLVHHDIWDYDIASPPTLINITVAGKPVRAVAQPTKHSFLFVFDRVTGKPVWPIEERPAPAGDVPGEWYSATQPYPTKPPPFDRQGIKDEDLIDFTPELKSEARELINHYTYGPLFTPATLRDAKGLLGTLHVPGNQGSSLWQGAAWDPETHMFYVPSVTNMNVLSLQPGGTRSDMRYIAGAEKRPDPPPEVPGVVANPPDGSAASATKPSAFRDPVAAFGAREIPRLGPGANRGPWGLGPQGLPLLKPPYGRITAYNLDTGDMVFQVANGETYDWIKSHPALKGMNIPRTGRADEGGILVTRTLMFAGQGCGLFRAGSGGGTAFYAYDKKTGDVIHEITLPGGTCGNPMTYSVNGRQFIVVAVGSRTTPAEFVALALPSSQPAPAAAPAGE
jgi:quinoprotein glucose dehydrogenase